MSLLTEVEDIVCHIKSGDKLESLKKAKLMVTQLNLSELKEVLRPDHIAPIIECFNSQEKEIISNATYISERVLPLLEPLEVMKNLSLNFQTGLSSDNPKIKRLCLKEINRWCESKSGSESLITEENVVISVIGAIATTLEMSLISTEILRMISKHSLKSTEKLLSGKYLKTIVQTSETSDEVKVRIYDLVVKILSISPEHLQICLTTDVIDNCINELRKDDILMRATTIAVINEIGKTAHGFEYLSECGALSTLITMATTAKSVPLGHLYMPQIIKFFGYMSQRQGIEKVMEVFSDFLKILFMIILEEDINAKQIAIETYGIIGYKDEGKIFLNKQPDKNVQCLKEVAKLMHHGNTKSRVCAIESYARLLDSESNTANEQISTITDKWFKLLDYNPVQMLIDLCKQPFLELRCAAMLLLQIVCKHAWGLQALADYAGFVEYILDRSTEMEKESKDCKYKVVQLLAASSNSMHIFGENNYLRFRTFANEGPYFVMAQSQIAVE